QNTGGQPVSVRYFLVGARDSSGGHVDFPVSAPVTLQPGQSYTYQGSRSFATAGTYTAWPACFDGSTWLELAPNNSTFVVATPATATPTATPPPWTRVEQTDPAVALTGG